MSKKYIYQNHRLIDEKQAKISIHERGFLFGDGFFETCKIINGEIFNFKAHERRINKALKYLKFSAKINDLEEKSLKLIKENKINNGILRISISRGIGSKGYLPTYESESLVIIETLETRKLPTNIKLGISKIKTPEIPFKSMNSIPYILAKIEAKKQSCFDVVMFSKQGFVAETSSANIFWVKNGKIYTPHESCGLVLGTIREKLLKIKDLKIKKTKAKISTLKNAEEIFLTNASNLVISVDQFDKRKLQKTYAKTIKGLPPIKIF